MTSRTKHFLILGIVFTALSILFTIGPALFFTVQGILTAELTIHKTALVGSIFIAIVGSLICLISKTFTFRSKIWIFLLALFFCLDNFIVVIIVFAATQITDELILSPIARHFRNKFTINNQIDKRGL